MRTIAIFCHGQNGDCMTISSVLRYREWLWPGCKIVWYIADENRDLLKYQDIELRTFPRGFGYPEMVVEENRKLVEKGGVPIWEDWAPLVNSKNQLDIIAKTNYPSLSDIDYGYFPAPHQIPPSKRHGWDYPVCSKKIFGVPDDYPWHPVLEFSDEEKRMAADFISELDEEGYGKKIFFETFAGSSQSVLSKEMVFRTMDICKRLWPDCCFIFGSHKFLRGEEDFPIGFFSGEITSCAEFTVRQTALIAEKCDLMISVSSGLSVAASAWDLKSPHILQFCGSFICSTKSLANGPFDLVTADNKSKEQYENEFYSTLEKILNQYK